MYWWVLQEIRGSHIVEARADTFGEACAKCGVDWHNYKVLRIY